MDERLETNQRAWEEMARIHPETAFYGVDRWKAGETRWFSRLPEPLEVAGQRVLHLQCHFGLDTLTMARDGAQVTGVDFSETAIETARSLATEAGLDARFVASNLYDVRDVLDEPGSFDLVVTYYGVLCWLPDLVKWAEIAAWYLRPGGTFIVSDGHPAAGMLELDDDPLRPRLAYSYFPGEADRWENEGGGTYAAPDAPTEHNVMYEWVHSLSEIVEALIGAGLRIEALREYPKLFFERWPGKMVQGEDGWWRIPAHEGKLPLMYLIRATKP